MPYIEKGLRKFFDVKIQDVIDELHLLPRYERIGVVNYVITKIVLGHLGNAPTYASYNAAIGVLECAKMELYRKRVAFYEDVKARLNGDVYEEDPNEPVCSDSD